MNHTDLFIGAIGVAVPPNITTQKDAETFLMKHFKGVLNAKSIDVIHKVFIHPSVRQRHFAFDDPMVLVQEDPDKRMERFRHWAVRLSSEAITHALESAGLTAKDISALVVNTCTGYLCPGISTYLLEALGFPKRTKVYDLAGSGCSGAIPNIDVCQGLLNASSDANKIVISVSVEICSCTFQMGDDVSLLISNAIFADGAAAAVVWKRPSGLKLISSHSYYAPEHREDIRYIYRHGQLHNKLSIRLPGVVAQAVDTVVKDLLKSQDIRVDGVDYWVLHPGGERVIDAIRKVVGLSDDKITYTHRVLEEYGNMSSPTVWFILRELQKSGITSGKRMVIVAFGAGLSAQALLLQTQGS